MSTTSIHEHTAVAATEDQKQFYEALLALGVSSPVAAFLRLRRNARRVHQSLAKANTLLRVGSRRRLALEKSPFNVARVQALDNGVKEINAACKELREIQEFYGRSLIDLAPWIDGTTTMTQRLELLNCNPADRAEIEEEDAGMVVLMAAYCVEDSAEHRNDEWNDRPLHAAVNAEMHRVMFRTPEGKAASSKLFDELLAPGGLLEGLPRYFQQPDGSFKRQAPPLTVHDADGSRVVERTPS
jgi:hypothetical protein